MIIFSLIIVGLIVAFFVVFLLIGYIISAPTYKAPVSDHFNGKQFSNPTGVKAKGTGEALKWMTRRKPAKWIEQKETIPGQKPLARVATGIRITFINHSTFLIQVDGLNILTDPIWSKRTSPVEWAGPKRMRPPGIRFEDLPKIDLILLSHNHWDHLDIVTVKKIYDTYQPKIVTPLGVGAFLSGEGVQSLGDLDWWQETKTHDDITIQCVPAQHFSGRGLFDRDATLWCGYVIKRPGGNIYFVGDTGYNDKTFKEIGDRCAPIEIALVPIGAYKPEWFMSPIHCSPQEAVKIHRECNARISIATHFGTFPLADDGKEEPVIALRQAMQEAGINDDAFLMLEEGKAYNF